MAIVLVSTDFTTNGVAANLAANTLTWILAGAVRVSTATAGAANVVTSTACEVRVDGTVAGELGGIRLLGSATAFDHVVTVGQTGLVLANRGVGVDIQGANANIVNQGTITARFDGIHTNGIATHIQNYGTILSTATELGASFGLALTGGQALIENFGTISSSTQAGAGINLATNGAAPGSRVENHGIIIGFDRSVLGSAADDVLVNTGTLIGTADLGAGRDLYDGAGGTATSVWGVRGGGGDDTLRGGDGADVLRGDAGNDLLQGRDGVDSLDGGDGNDRVCGMGGSDTVAGGLGNDRILGFNDDDVVDGGGGFDLMTGGQGSDVFLFLSAADIGVLAGARDAITDFNSGADQIDLSAIGGLTFIKGQVFGNVAGQARYATTTGQLQIDLDGNGNADAVLDLGVGTLLLRSDLLL